MLSALLENLTNDALAQLYVTKFSTISHYLTKLYVTYSFAIASSVTYSEIRQKLSNSACVLVPSSMTSPPTRLVTLMQMLSESHSELLLSTTVVSFPDPRVKATSPGDSTWQIQPHNNYYQINKCFQELKITIQGKEEIFFERRETDSLCLRLSNLKYTVLKMIRISGYKPSLAIA